MEVQGADQPDAASVGIRLASMARMVDRSHRMVFSSDFNNVHYGEALGALDFGRNHADLALRRFEDTQDALGSLDDVVLCSQYLADAYEAFFLDLRETYGTRVQQADGPIPGSLRVEAATLLLGGALALSVQTAELLMAAANEGPPAPEPAVGKRRTGLFRRQR